MLWNMVSLLLNDLSTEDQCLYKDTLSVRVSVNQSSHTSFYNFLAVAFWSAVNSGISGIRIKPFSKTAFFTYNGPALEKNGALQCVVSVANPHDSLLTIIAQGWEGFQQQPIQPEPALLWPIVC